MTAPATCVVESARLELLRVLADSGDWIALFESDWRNSDADMLLAVGESEKIGHVKSGPPTAATCPNLAARLLAMRHGRARELMVRITPAGAAWIRAHDKSLSPSRGSAE